MVDVAQLVESRIVIPVVVGSSPIVHPSICKHLAPYSLGAFSFLVSHVTADVWLFPKYSAPKFDLRTHLFRMCRVNRTRFTTAGHFTSWLGLCPGTKITGGKVMNGKTVAWPTVLRL